MDQVEIVQVIESRGFEAHDYLESVIEYKLRLNGVVMDEAEFLLVVDGVRA